MLKMNLHGVMRQRGIPNPTHFLVKNGFTYHTANRLLRNAQDSVSNKNLEKLCLLLNCTIDDLYVWQKPKDAPISKEHPLHKLLPKVEELDMLQKMQELPLEKLEQIKQFMKDL